MNNQTLQNATQASELLKVMAHPERLIVICKLMEGEKGVGELLKDSALSQSAFSQHLTLLRKHHIIKARKVSQQVFYSVSDDRVAPIVKAFQQVFCKP